MSAGYVGTTVQIRRRLVQRARTETDAFGVAKDGPSDAGRGGRIARSWRLTRVAWGLMRTHREMQVLAFLGVVSATAASGLILYLGGYFSDGQDDRGHLAVIALLAGYASTLVSVFFNVALASAADEALEGRSIDVREALRESMGCLASIAIWSAIAVAVGVLINTIARRIPWGGRLLEWLAGTAWALATIFVVPVLALEGRQAVPAIRRSAELFKTRWGEGISGNLTIGAWTLLVTLPAAFAICTGLSVADRYTEAGVLLVAGGVITMVVACVLASATRGVFAVALYRYAIGDSAGPFPVADLDQPFEPRRTLARSRIWGWIAVAVVSIVLLSVVGVLIRDRERPVRAGPPTSYDATLPRSEGALLHNGMPLYWHHNVVGHVTYTTERPTGSYIRFVIEPSFAQQMWDMDGQLELYRSRQDPRVTWFNVFPRRPST